MPAVDIKYPHESSNSNGHEPSAKRLAACAVACEGIPTAELEAGILLELVAACVHLREDERVRNILDRLAPRKPPAIRAVPALTPSDKMGMTAAEKFRIGMRVRISPAGHARMPESSASTTGTVRGFSDSPVHVRVARDGRSSPERFHMDFWEEDPDYHEANESSVSGLWAAAPSRRCD